MKKYFNWGNFILYDNNRSVVHCRTKEQADDFCDRLHKNRLKIYGTNLEKKPLTSDSWNYFKEESCYNNEGLCAHRYSYEQFNVTILEWSDYYEGKAKH